MLDDRFELLKIAGSVRRALERECQQFEPYKDYDRDWPDEWHPSDQCDVSSQVLEEVFKNEGIKDVTYIVGLVAIDDDPGDEPDLEDDLKEELGIPLNKFAAYHYWLEIGKDRSKYKERRPANIWVVDITADQFNNLIYGKKFPKVIVAKYKDLPRHFRTGPA